MRIVFLCTSSLEDASPRGRWVPIAHELTKDGHEVHLLLLHQQYDRFLAAKPNPTPLCLSAGVYAHYVSQMHVYGSPGQRHYFGARALLQVTAQAAWRLLRETLALKPDLIHICKPQPMNGVAGWLAARWLGCPYFVDCDDYEAEANRFGAVWQKRLVQFFENTLPKGAKGVTVNTRYLFERVHQLGVHACRIAYVPNGMNNDAPTAISPPNLAHPTVVYVGTMSKLSHGTDLLIAAFAQVLTHVPLAKLCMVGDGDDKADLMQQAQTLGINDAIDWVGRVAPEQTRKYYRQAVCSVDPVYDKPAMKGRSPLKIVESLAYGVPVVTSDLGDRGKTLLGAKPCGVLVAPGNASALAQGMIELIQHPDLQRSLAINALLRSQDYAWAQLARQWAQIYTT